MALCSIAVAAGVVGMVALIKRVVLGRRFGHGHLAFAGGPCGAGGGGFGGHGCGGEGGAPWRGRWRGRGWGAGGGSIGRSLWLRALYAKLDTTPGQEREIRAALEELRERARDAKADLPEARQNIGKALAGEELDASAFEAVSARFDATGEKLKDAGFSALRRIHAVLDPKQRERLAAIVASGGLGRWRRGDDSTPYRG